MKKRIVIIILAALLVALLATGLGVFSHTRSLGSERNELADYSVFITPDTTSVTIARCDLADEGVAAMLTPLIETYDERRTAAAGRTERLAYYLLGFDRPSDALTRPLPAEAILLTRYDRSQKQCHAQLALSVSGLGRLLERAAGHIPAATPEPRLAFLEREHGGHTLYVPKSATPPGTDLKPHDVTALLAPLKAPGAAWTVAGNTFLVARTPDSLTSMIDRLAGGKDKSERTPPILKLLPQHTDGLDMRGVLLNRHGEIAALFELMAESMDSKPLRLWLDTPRAQAHEDIASILAISFTVDIQPGDRVVSTSVLRFSDLDRMRRVAAILEVAFREYRPPPPIKFKARPGLALNGIEVTVTATGVGEFLKRSAGVSDR